MLDLILIIILIVSLSKPEILLSKEMKEKANDDQKNALVSNLRKQYGIIVASLESLALMRHTEIIGGILAIVCLILLFKVAIPAKKEVAKIMKELQ